MLYPAELRGPPILCDTLFWRRVEGAGMRIPLIAIAAALIAIAACTPASPIDGMQPGERGRVVRVLDGDAIVLDTGQSVRLVGIEAPARGSRDREGQPFAAEAARSLEDLVMGREVQLYYPGLTRDRYDRALAHIVTADAAGPEYWVNHELVRRGDVRVRVYPDTAAGGDALLEVERAARDEGRGLWRLLAYQPKSALSVDETDRGFLIVEGVLAGTAPLPDETYRKTLCTRRLEDSGLLVDMTFTSRPACDAPEGAVVRLRGWVKEKRMELVHPLHLEFIE